MNPLDSFTFPLQGASLIEASAGTGKTYTIVNLVLRLLIGHKCRALTIEQILVVTFTNAATSELKDRIRLRIQSAYLDFYRGESEEDFIKQLIGDIDDLAQVCERLNLAMKQMDEASIFTIHSYCQRMLTQYAFESGAVYNEKLEVDESKWLEQAVNDYWRKSIVPLTGHEIQQINLFWKTPEDLKSSLLPFLSQNISEPSSQNASQNANQNAELARESARNLLTVLEQTVYEVKRWWLDSNVSETLQNAKLKKTTKLGKPALYAQMDAFCNGDSLISPFAKTGWSDLFPDKLTSACSAASPDLSLLDFSRFEELQALSEKVKKQFINAYFTHALQGVKANLQQHKQSLGLLAPDDLLQRMHRALSNPNGSKLRDLICEAFPTALIDEFQDTDSIQFDIFSQIYLRSESVRSESVQSKSDGPNQSSCLVMIGDPKQAIYGFRGADIYTYLLAKEVVPATRHYTLTQNWRSQALLVEATNTLFANSEHGFLFDDQIPFMRVTAAKPEASLYFQDERLASLHFAHVENDNQALANGGTANGVTANKTAHGVLANDMAKQLVTMLTHGHIKTANKPDRKVVAGDCCILVRDRNEATLIKQTLTELNIASVFLARESVFSSRVSRDLFVILSAIAAPTDERKLRAALLTTLLGFTASEIEKVFLQDNEWQPIVEQFFIWHQMWQRSGVMITINSVMSKFEVYNKSAKQGNIVGLREITDLRHLTEILQHQSDLIAGQNQLLHWFAEQLAEPDHKNESQQLRLESDANLVQIVTMHASKGLEFPIVFVPFAAAFRLSKNAIFHDQNQQLVADFTKQSSNLELADQERLAEDIRLFYVAVTRAIYHCSIGIWNPPATPTSKQSALFSTALGKILLKGSDAPTNNAITKRIWALASDKDISYQKLSLAEPVIEPYQAEKYDELKTDYTAEKLHKKIVRDWQLTSYSAIAREQGTVEYDVLEGDKPGRDERESAVDFDPQGANEMSRFTFTKGAQAGSFLHGVLENICFSHPQDIESTILQQSQWYGIEEEWLSLVRDWVLDLIRAPINQDGLSLHKLLPNQVNAEMEFHIPLKSVEVSAFNKLVNQVFKTATRQYGFEKLNGMLKGFIDLTFEFEGRFYVADYKSNYLGNDFHDYNLNNMEKAMVEHDYHLQSLLYIVALHRYLRVNLTGYDYKTHIGGAYYLFLRGMSADSANTGSYYYLPEERDVLAMDKLFSNEQINTVDENATQLDLW